MVTMNTAAATSAMRPEWFAHGVLKPGCRDEFFTALEAKREEAKAELKDFMARIKKNGTNVKLSREDLAYLSAHYDPRNMTSDEYRAFVDDLCRIGVFEEADKDYVSYTYNVGGYELSRVVWEPDSITENVSPVYDRYSSSFSSSSGNVLDWSRYLSTFEYFNTDTQSFEKTRSVILFDMMQDVLNQMAAA